VDWYYKSKEGKKGPVDTEFIKNLIKEGVLLSSDYVWNKTMGDTWTRIQELPVLIVPQFQLGSRQASLSGANFDELHRLHARERLVRRIIFVAVVAVIALGGYAGYHWMENKPLRRWGIDAENPLGQFVILDKFLAAENLMDKASVDNCELTHLRSAQMYSYSNPKAERGTFVSGAGTLTLLLDETGKVKGVHAVFPSSGPRGGLAAVNECVVGMFIKQYWRMLSDTKEEEPKLARISTATPLILESFELTAALPDSNFAVLTCGKVNVRGFWFEYGHAGQASMILLLRGEDQPR
jgi:hypothetical protein